MAFEALFRVIVSLLAVNVLAAISFGFAWQVLRVYHLAWGGILLSCMYLCLYLFRSGSQSTLLIATVSICVGLVLSCLTEWLLYRPLIRHHANTSMMLVASLGLLVVVQAVASILFGTSLHTIASEAPPRLYAATFDLALVMASVAAVIPAVHSTGLRLQQAVGDDLDLARSLGIRAFKVRSIGVSISGALIGLLAFLVVQSVGVHPSYGLRYVLWASVAVLVGGASSYSGWVVGGVLLSIAQAVAIWWFPSAWADLLTLSFLLAILLLRPRGFLAAPSRVEVGS